MAVGSPHGAVPLGTCGSDSHAAAIYHCSDWLSVIAASTGSCSCGSCPPKPSSSATLASTLTVVVEEGAGADGEASSCGSWEVLDVTRGWELVAGQGENVCLEEEEGGVPETKQEPKTQYEANGLAGDVLQHIWAATATKPLAAATAKKTQRGTRTWAALERVWGSFCRWVNILLVVITSAALLVELTWLVMFWAEDGLAAPCPPEHDMETTWVDRVVVTAIRTVLSPLLAVFLAPVTLWVVTTSSTPHLHAVAHLAATNWMHRILTLLQDLRLCTHSNDSALANRLELLGLVGFFLYGLIQSLALTLDRIAAVERSSMVSFGTKCVNRLFLVGLPLAAIATAMYTAQGNSGEMTPVWQWLRSVSGWLFLAWTLIAMSVVIRGLCVMKNLIDRASRSSQAELAGVAGLSGRTLRSQTRGAIFTLVSSLFRIIMFFMQYDPLVDHWWRTPAASHLSVVKELISALDTFTISYFVLALSGATSGALRGSARRKLLRRRVKRRWGKAAAKWRLHQEELPLTPERADWDQKIHELAGRGVSLDVLLTFYRQLVHLMPDFDFSRHTTLDVVRRVIIPLSAERQCACSTLLMQGCYTRPTKMVTHTWSGRFHDLVAAVLSDALQEPSYALTSQLLAKDPELLALWLAERGLGERTYWICAFSVNQHLCICASNPTDSKDSVTGLVHVGCKCGLPKVFNETPPVLADGRSTRCEMNKFDELMRYLSATDSRFAQVVAIDVNFEIFHRAWCMAEIATARSGGMQQRLRVPSMDSLQKHAQQLRNLKIQEMQASRPEDKRQILRGISDVEAFNAGLQGLLFDELIPSWDSMDTEEQMAHAGRVIKWHRTLQTYGLP